MRGSTPPSIGRLGLKSLTGIIIRYPMAGIDSQHTASAPATGYLFQCRYALLRAIEAIPESPELEISIEKFDDVAFEAHGLPVELIQAKHHIGTAGSLSDASSDLWKTLLIWSKRVARDAEAPFRTKFVLMTTATAPDGSGASYLRMRERGEQEADERLLATASTSQSKTNADAYAAYRALPIESRLNMLKATVVLDNSPNIIDVRDDIVRALFHAVPRDKLSLLVERLEGWWFGLVIKALSGAGPDSIRVVDIDKRIDELREDFKRSALPVDFASATPTPAIVAELDKRPFVKQLRTIEIGTKRIEYAIRDYYRASEQRSRWAREELLIDGELENYERELTEAWEPRYAAMVEELAATSLPTEKIAKGQELFKWAEVSALFPLRSVQDRFLTHGSYHILANRYAVGWHPDFLQEAAELSANGTS
jgi:hypothetical protein